MRDNKYDLRGNNTLSLPKVNTTKYGLNSFRYFAAKQWNSIPNELRLRAGGLEFNKQVRNIQFQLSNFVILDARYFICLHFYVHIFLLSFLILICGKPAKQLQLSVSPTLNKDYVMLCYVMLTSGRPLPGTTFFVLKFEATLQPLCSADRDSGIFCTAATALFIAVKGLS